MWTLPDLKRGDRVEVRSREEILATLDAGGTLAGMPFMPEMLEFCGRQFTVAAVAHKTCDTATRTGGRKLERMVHLEGTRCDGSAHGGCEADCNLFWREEWLKRVPAERGATPAHVAVPGTAAARGCTLEALRTATHGAGSTADSPVYSCQATCLVAASRPLPWWNLRQYWRDVRTGNHSLTQALTVLTLAAAHRLISAPFGYRLFRACYRWLHLRLTGRPAPQIAGTLAPGATTPVAALGLKPGERVRVRSATEIAATLSVSNKNRGMLFDTEETPYCGQVFTVRRPVTRIIDERSGRMSPLRTPCVTLEGVICRAHYSTGRMLCPRAIEPFWRDVWLERLDRDARRD
jgi:hypothetical protein